MWVNEPSFPLLDCLRHWRWTKLIGMVSVELQTSMCFVPDAVLSCRFWPALCKANIMRTASHAHKQDVASLFFRKPGMLVHVFLWYHHLWIHVTQSSWPTAMAVRNHDCTASPPRMPYQSISYSYISFTIDTCEIRGDCPEWCGTC